MYILYGNGSGPSGRILRRLLSCRGGTPPHMARNPNATNDLLIRYGVSSGADAPTTLNRAEAIERAAHKGRALRTLDEAGVLVPNYAESGESDSLSGTILGRSYHGSGGEDIVIYPPGTTVGRHRLYTQFIPSVREMRIHIFQGEMIHAQVKQRVEVDGEAESEEYPIRNHSRGYVFVPYVRTRPNKDRVVAAQRAVAALGLDFGAVDLLVGADGNVYVLEVNTGPGLTPRTALAYARAFEGWCNANGVDVTLDEATLELDSEEEACYNEVVEATSAPSEPMPTESGRENPVQAVGQDRGTTDEREVLQDQISNLRDDLTNVRAVALAAEKRVAAAERERDALLRKIQAITRAIEEVT